MPNIEPGREYAFKVKGIPPLRWTWVRDILRDTGVTLINNENTPYEQLKEKFGPADAAMLSEQLALRSTKILEEADKMDDPEFSIVSQSKRHLGRFACTAAQWFKDREMCGDLIEVCLFPAENVKWGVVLEVEQLE